MKSNEPAAFFSSSVPLVAMKCVAPIWRASSSLSWRRGDRRHLAAEGRQELHGQVAQAADPDDRRPHRRGRRRSGPSA